jgi:hypothetical protein
MNQDFGHLKLRAGLDDWSPKTGDLVPELRPQLDD